MVHNSCALCVLTVRLRGVAGRHCHHSSELKARALLTAVAFLIFQGLLTLARRLPEGSAGGVSPPRRGPVRRPSAPAAATALAAAAAAITRAAAAARSR
eukprot:357598-Chlamydomonas_euryale.AAC.3